MAKVVVLNESLSVRVVAPGELNTVLSPNDRDMDFRATEAVKAAIRRAEVCKKPIARYDKERRRAYIEMPDGERQYV